MMVVVLRVPTALYVLLKRLPLRYEGQTIESGIGEMMIMMIMMRRRRRRRRRRRMMMMMMMMMMIVLIMLMMGRPYPLRSCVGAGGAFAAAMERNHVGLMIITWCLILSMFGWQASLSVSSCRCLAGHIMFALAWALAVLSEQQWHENHPKPRGSLSVAVFYLLALASGVLVVVQAAMDLGGEVGGGDDDEQEEEEDGDEEEEDDHDHHDDDHDHDHDDDEDDDVCTVTAGDYAPLDLEPGAYGACGHRGSEGGVVE
jgi:hypothetical protein